MIETPSRRQLVDQDGEALELRRRQARRRLVHGDDLGVFHDGARDLDDLALGDLQGRIGAAGSIVGSSGARASAARAAPAARATDEQAAGGVQRAAEEHVLRDGQLRELLQFLVDHRDARRAAPRPGRGGRRAGRRSRRALVAAEDAGEDAAAASTCRRRSRRAAHAPSPGSTVMVDAVERAHGAKALAKCPPDCRRSD